MKSRPLHEIPGAILTRESEKLAPGKPPDGVVLQNVPGGPVKGEWHCSVNAEHGRTVLYLHGGGYFFGSAKMYRRVTFGLAQNLKANVFSLDYRLADSASYPAALDDALTAYNWLLQEGVPPENLVVAGDSAGAGLALALLLKLKEKGAPMPAGAVLLSPWTDLACTGDSLNTNCDTDVMFQRIHIEWAAKKYCGGVDPKTPFVSPLFAELAGFPPTQIFVSISEMLRDDALRLHDRLKEAGVSSMLIAEDGLTHVWPIFYGWIPEARKSMKQITSFCEDLWSQNPKQEEAAA